VGGIEKEAPKVRKKTGELHASAEVFRDNEKWKKNEMLLWGLLRLRFWRHGHVPDTIRLSIRM